MAGFPQPLTSNRLAALAAGLFVLSALTVWHLGGDKADPVSDSGIIELSGETMGTTYSVKVAAKDDSASQEHLRIAVEAALMRVNAGMSTYIEDSELSRLNQAPAEEVIEVAEETFARIANAQRVSEETGGAFDITIGPIVQAYGFGSETVLEFPSDEKLDALFGRVGYRKLKINDDLRTVVKTTDGMYCDLSAIAKGHGVDAVVETLVSHGVESCFVEIGGEVRAVGEKSGGEVWRVGIERPDETERRMHRAVPLRDIAMATSGDYRNYYEQDGWRISHIIDARTGRPIDHALASVSVLHERCEMADAYATALMVLGPGEGMRLAERLDLAALFLVREGDEFVERESPAFSAYIEASAAELEQ